MKVNSIDQSCSIPYEIKDWFSEEGKRGPRKCDIPWHFADFLKELFSSEEYKIKGEDDDEFLYMDCYMEVMDSFARIKNKYREMSVTSLLNNLEIKLLLSDERYPYFCKILTSRALFVSNVKHEPNAEWYLIPVFDTERMTMKEYFETIRKIKQGKLSEVLNDVMTRQDRVSLEITYQSDY